MTNKKYAKCKLCGLVIDSDYLNCRTPTEAISDHVEIDHPRTLLNLEKEIDPSSDTTELSLFWDLYIDVTDHYRKEA